MKNYLKVEGHNNLYRDPRTGAIVNADAPKRSASQNFNAALEDINTLKAEISEIKQLLKEFIRNGSS